LLFDLSLFLFFFTFYAVKGVSISNFFIGLYAEIYDSDDSDEDVNIE
jgi:hypothetical protein